MTTQYAFMEKIIDSNTNVPEHLLAASCATDWAIAEQNGQVHRERKESRTAYEYGMYLYRRVQSDRAARLNLRVNKHIRRAELCADAERRHNEPLPSPYEKLKRIRDELNVILKEMEQ